MMKRRKWTQFAVVVGTALTLPILTVGHTDQTLSAITNTTDQAEMVAPIQAPLPPLPAKALQMSQAGVDDKIIVSYIDSSGSSYALSPQQIIYLHDLGISSAVLEALVKHEGPSLSATSSQASGELAPTQDMSSTASTSQPAPPMSGTAANFYAALAPYGTWVNLPGYGWCWQPTAVVANTAWQPYCNNGCWLWTDNGWYWDSYYTWGWAPFHYGRWFQRPGYGWLWCPDDVWGPAWVCWRDYPDYCGWAPLPPGSRFAVGIGWTFHGSAVGFNFGFGLGARCFTFCDYDNFCRRHPFGHFRHDRDADQFFNHSRVDNDWTGDAHHHFFDHGINLSRIESATHRHIAQISVRNFPHNSEHNSHFRAPDRLTQSGNRQVIYRFDHVQTAMQSHFRHGIGSIHNRNVQHVDHGVIPQHKFDNITQSRPNMFHIQRPSSSNPVLGRPDLNHFNFNEHWGSAGNARPRHGLPTPHNHGNFSDSRHFSPVLRNSPAFHRVPSRHSPQTRPTTHAWHRVAPVSHPVTPAIRHSIPVFHQRRVFHAATSIHGTLTPHPAPAFHAPAFHTSPAHSHSTHGSGSVHGGGSGSHHRVGRHR